MLIVAVNENSGAARAGLRGTALDRRGSVQRLGDVIVAAAGQEVKNFDDLLRTLENLEEGDRVKLKVLRDQKEIEVAVELGPSNAQLFRRQRG